MGRRAFHARPDPPRPVAVQGRLRAAGALAIAFWLTVGGGALAQAPPPPTPAATGPRLSISLADAVFIGLRDNRTVRSAYIARAAEKFDLLVARARFQPAGELAASTAATGQGDADSRVTTLAPSAYWLVPTGAEFRFGWSRQSERVAGASLSTETTTLSVTQPLLRGGGLAVNAAPVRIAELQERINQQRLRATLGDMVTTIITAYRGLMQAQEQLAIADAALERSRTQLRTNQALIDAGRMAAADLLQTEADIANQEVALLQARQSRNTARLALLNLLGMDLHTDIVATDSLSAEHLSIDLEAAIATALAGRPDYLSQRQALEQARQDLIVARNDRLWSLSLTGSLQRQDQSGAVAPSPSDPTATVGLALRIPLGDHSFEQREIHARTAVRTQELQLEDARQRIEAQVRDAAQGVELSWRRLEAARLARDLAARALDMEREKLKAGRASNFELLTFETNLRLAETQALTAAIGYLNALTSLDQQLGATLDTWKINLDD